MQIFRFRHVGKLFFNHFVSFFLGTLKMSVALMLTPPPQKKRKRIDRIPNGKNLTIIQEINIIEQDRRIDLEGIRLFVTGSMLRKQILFKCYFKKEISKMNIITCEI